MLIDTRSGNLAPVLATNATQAGTAVTQPADQTATPSTVTTAGSEAGVWSLGSGGAFAPNAVQLVPFGTSVAAQTFLMGVFGWDMIVGNQTTVQDSWHATLLASFTCTLSTTAVGLANTVVNASQFYCDTITLLVGNANVSNEILSPTANRAGCVRVDVAGARYLDVRFWMNGSAASANALFRVY